MQFLSMQLADIVAARAQDGKIYGVILLPEGLIEHIPEVKHMLHSKHLLMQGFFHLLCAALVIPLTWGVTPGLPAIHQSQSYESLQIGALIQELNEVLADTDVDVSCHDSLVTKLTPANLAIFQFLPTEVRQQLLLDRDPHGNVQVLVISGPNTSHPSHASL